MAYTEFRHGSLAVIQEAHDSSHIQRELKKLDDRLFLEQQIGFDQVPVWCVVVDVGGDQPPITIMEWRDQETNQPIYDLTSGLVDRVARMERDGARLASRVIKANRDKIDAQKRESMDAYRAHNDEHLDAILGKSSPMFHRSKGLQMSRDKARARGEIV